MAKRKHTYWLEDETHVLIESEAGRLTAEYGKKIGHADVIALAIVKWCSVGDVEPAREVDPPDSVATIRERAEAAIRSIETKPAEVIAPKVSPRAESVAQRKARETKEHAAALAESDVMAKMTGRTDIDYDLDNVPHRSVATIGVVQRGALGERSKPQIYDVVPRKVKLLTRPHGATEPKRRREQA